MPSGMAAAARKQIAQQDKSGLVLERSPYSSTGFKQVIKVGKQYQARLQVKGDGRGGSRKRKQHSLPGLFATAEQAAEFRAWIKQEYPSWEVDGPPAQIEERKPRSKPAKPAQHAAMPLLPLMPMPCTACVMAMPIPTPMLNAPFVAVSALPPSPLPMQPLGFVPPPSASLM